MIRRSVVAFLFVASTIASGQTISITPATPTTANVVRVLCDSYFGITSESHSVTGNTISVHFVQGTFDWDPNPPFAPGIATIGALPAGTYAVGVDISFGTNPPTHYTYSLTVADSQPEGIPALNPWGLVCLATLVAVAALFRLRRAREGAA